MVDDIESAILKRLENPLAFEPYRSAKRREYPYYRIYVRNYVVYYVVIGNVMEVEGFTSASKSSSGKLNKKIATINKAIVGKDEEIIYDQMSDDLKKDGDKLRTQLKEFVNFVPGEITEVTDRSYGTLSHSERYDKSPDGYYGVTTYRLSYNAIDDQNFEYVITMEYIKENKANPGEVGLNYVNIYKFDSDGKRIGFMEIGNTLV